MEEIKKLLNTATLKHSSVTLTGTLLNGILGVLFFICTARILGPESFGLFSVSIVVLTFVADVADFGINTGLINFISKSIHSDKEKAFQIMKLGLEIKFIIWFLILVIGLLIAPFIARVVFLKPELTTLLQISFVGVGGAMLFSFVTNCLQAFQKFYYWSVLNVSLNALRLVLVLCLAVVILLNSADVLIIYILIPFIGFIFGLFLLPLDFLRVTGEKRVFHDFFHYNKWVGFSVLISSLTSRIDTFLVTRMTDIFQVGLYSVAVQLTSFIPQFVYALAVVVAPKLGGFDSDEKAFKYLKKLQILCFGLGVIGLIGIPIAYILIPFFYGVEYVGSLMPFIFLFLAQLLFLISIPSHQAIYYYFSTPKVFLVFSFIQLVIITILGMILIPSLGINGAAIAILGGSIFNFLAPSLWVLKKFRK